MKDPALYLDPTYGVDEWTAEMWCDNCEEDRIFEFGKQFGAILAVCSDCGNDVDIEE